MKRTAIAVLLLGAISAVRGTTNGQGTLYPFEISTLLKCYVEQKTADGRTSFAEESPPRLPFGIRIGQGNSTRVFLPQDTTFRQPPFVLTQELQDILSNFLAESQTPAITTLLTSVNRPVRDPPRACEILPAFEGSAGQTKKHVEVVEEPFPLGEDVQNTRTFVSTLPQSISTVNLMVDGINISDIPRDQTTREELIGSPLLPENFNGLSFFTVNTVTGTSTRRRYQEFINDIEAMCPLWIAKCPLTPVWAELPQTFFPRYIAQGTCSGKNCSYPRGLHCEEDFIYTVYITVLRWDCCYNAFLGQLRWDCGWRPVQVPLLCDCTCGCGPVFPNTALSSG